MTAERDPQQTRPAEQVSADELAAEGGAALPDKEVMSLLDLNANLDLALDLAAPVDLAIGANANVAAPIDAAVGANVLSDGSTVGAETVQGGAITQGVTGDATATSDQVSSIDQTAAPAEATTTTADPTTTAGALDGPLLNVNVDLSGDLNLTAPIDGAVAANANVAAPIDAAVGANVGSIDSSSTAIAHQDVAIDQNIDGNATATADQSSDISQ
jgi:hypothetical protein